MLHCYDSSISGDAGLKYGIGASEQGNPLALEHYYSLSRTNTKAILLDYLD